MRKKSISLLFLGGVAVSSLGVASGQSTIGVCQLRQTQRVIQIGQTCVRAQDRAAAAAQFLATCNPGETVCGPTSVFVSNACFPNPVSGQISAEAFAEFACFTLISSPELGAG